MKKICTLLFIAMVMLVSSCLKYDREEGLQLTKALKVTVSVDDMETVSTKSAVTAQDATAANFNIWLYDDSGLVYDGYFTDADDIKIEKLTVGKTYHIRAVANVGVVTPPTSLAAADAMTFEWGVSALNASAGIPMTYKESLTLSLSSSINISFRRVAAKYTFIIDQSGFSGTYTIKSFRLCNAPSKVLAFADSKVDGSAITATDGDYATDVDLSKLNQGIGMPFYVYENNQGEVLSGNTDPWKKEFVNHNVAKAAYASKCTYLEVQGDYAAPGLDVKNLKYRIYLGKNATSNFDVTRNTAYTVVLMPQDDAALDETFASWKVERGTITDTRSLAFSPASVEVPSMGQATATVVPNPAAVEYVLEGGDGFAAAGLSFERSGNGVTVKSGSIVHVNTTAKLKASTKDGRISEELTVTVLPPTVTSVTVAPADGWSLAKGLKKDFTATATYSAGDPADVTAYATWTGDSYVTLDGTPAATASFKGAATSGANAATVTASFGGKSGSSKGTVTPPEVVSIAVEPATKDMEQGDTFTFSVNATYSDGTVAPLTEDITWNSSDNAGLRSDGDGKFTAVSLGNFTVTAKVGTLTGTATVGVTPKLLSIEVTQSPAGNIRYGESKTLSVTAHYSDSSYDKDATAQCTFTPSSNLSRNGSVFVGTAVGAASVTVEYLGKEAVVNFDVVNAVASLAITPANGWESFMDEDKSFTATATMLDGTTQDVTSTATWSTTTTATLTKNTAAGSFNTKAAGEATVKAECEGKSDTSTGTVKENVFSYRIALSGSSVTVITNQTASVTPTVMYYVTKNNVEDAGTDVTAGAILRSKNTGVATVSGTTVTGVAVGTTKLYAEYNNGSQVVSSDKATGGSYIDVTVSDKSVDRYEYNEPILELSYGDVGADGSAASPTLTYSQTATRVWSDGSTDENVVMAAAGSAIPSGVTVTWGGSAKNSSGGAINSGNGQVSAKNRETTAYSRGVVYTATVSAKIPAGSEGKTGSTTKDVYQQENKIETKGDISLTVNGVGDIPASGGTSAVPGFSYSQNVVYTSGKSKTVTSGATVYYGTSSNPTSTSSSKAQIYKSGLGTTPKDRTSVGRAYIKVALNGMTAEGSTGVWQQANSSTKTENDVKYGEAYDPNDGNCKQSVGAESSDSNYWVKIGDKTSGTIDVLKSKGSISVTAGHTRQPRKQEQHRDKYYTHDTYKWTSDEVSYDDVRGPFYGGWYNSGSPYNSGDAYSVPDTPSDVSVESGQSWLTKKSNTELEYGANSGGARSATASAENGSASITVTVSQEGVTYSIDVGTNSLSFDYNEYGTGSTKTVTVTCPVGDWEISSKPASNWSVTKSGNTVVVYPTSANGSTETPKTGTVVVRCTGDTSKTQTISLTQGTKPDEYEIVVE